MKAYRSVLPPDLYHARVKRGYLAHIVDWKGFSLCGEEPYEWLPEREGQMECRRCEQALAEAAKGRTR